MRQLSGFSSFLALCLSPFFFFVIFSFITYLSSFLLFFTRSYSLCHFFPSHSPFYLLFSFFVTVTFWFGSPNLLFPHISTLCTPPHFLFFMHLSLPSSPGCLADNVGISLSNCWQYYGTISLGYLCALLSKSVNKPAKRWASSMIASQTEQSALQPLHWTTGKTWSPWAHQM